MWEDIFQLCIWEHFTSMCESITVVYVKGFTSFYASFSVVYVSVSFFNCLCETVSVVYVRAFHLYVCKVFSIVCEWIWFHMCMYMLILNNVLSGPHRGGAWWGATSEGWVRKGGFDRGIKVDDQGSNHNSGFRFHGSRCLFYLNVRQESNTVLTLCQHKIVAMAVSLSHALLL